MGPSCGLAEMKDGKLTVWTHAQGVYPLRMLLARVCKLAPDAIHVLHRQGAGTYGHNGSDDAAMDAAVIAVRRPGKPIRVQWRREDEFGHEPLGTAMRIDLAAELDASGRLVDYTAEIWTGSHTGGRGRCLAEVALGLRGAAADDPADRSRRDAVLRRRAQRHTVLRHPGPSVHRACGERAGAHLVAARAGRTGEHLRRRMFHRRAGRAGRSGPAGVPTRHDDRPARESRCSTRLAEMAGWNRRGPAGSGKGLGLAYCRYRGRGAYVAAAAAVSVETEVTLDHMWCVTDCGQVINPDGAKNQLEGGMIMAASWALKEQVRLAGRGVVTTTWGDYPILRFDEVPPVDVELIMQQHEPSSGTGEVSSGPALAAIGNAVAHALGARIRELPYTRERVAHALLA